MTEIVINDEGTRTRAGSIIFNETPDHLRAVRTATGYNLTIPMKVGLKSAPADRPRLALGNIRLILSVKDGGARTEVEVGRIHHDGFYSAFVSDGESSEMAVDADLTWPTTFQVLVFIESTRSGKVARFHFKLRGELHYIVICEQWQGHVRAERKRFHVLTEPQRVIGQTEVTYPKDVWDDMVQGLLNESQDDPYLMLLPLASLLSWKKP